MRAVDAASHGAVLAGAAVILGALDTGVKQHSTVTRLHARIFAGPQSKIVWPEFDPYSTHGARVMERIDELIAQGRVIDAPLSSGKG
jgi:hypothetical protein